MASLGALEPALGSVWLGLGSCVLTLGIFGSGTGD